VQSYDVTGQLRVEKGDVKKKGVIRKCKLGGKNKGGTKLGLYTKTPVTQKERVLGCSQRGSKKNINRQRGKRILRKVAKGQKRRRGEGGKGGNINMPKLYQKKKHGG